MTRTAIIAGAGPAGLTAAYELLKQRTGITPVIFEQSDEIGGISKTVNHNGNRMDIGGHRFFSKNKRVMDWWTQVMPMQGAPSLDDILLNREKPLAQEGPDPEAEDRVMLTRQRVSRIFYLQRFFDYPVTLKWQTLRNMGLWRTVKAGWGYLAATIHKRKEDSLEDFYINRFGRPLYSMFFEDYTEKVWGLHPSKLGADWGSQRVKGLSILAIIKDIFTKKLGVGGKVETSLIEEFIYPKLGPGQLWETVAQDAADMGADLQMNTNVSCVNIDPATHRVASVTVTDNDGNEHTLTCDYFLSSMPIKDLIAAIRGIDVPEAVKQTAAALPYRDFITVGLLVDKMAIKNETKIKTYAERVPDTWIYIQEREVRIGRLQIFNNWSPYMVRDYKDRVWIGLEYFCSEGDDMWTMSDRDFIDMAIRELISIGIIKDGAVHDSVRIKVRKAYPAYHGAYYQLDDVRTFLDTIPNLFCIGRNGQHRYNNMDHSMLTAMAAVECIATGNADKTAVWSVNTEDEYHETQNATN